MTHVLETIPRAGTRYISLLLLLLCSATAHAQLYKWVGPDGKVSYSDSPPPSTAAKVETKSLSIGSVSAGDFPFELSEVMKSSPVMLYTTKNCTVCDEGRKLLTARGIPFTEKTVNSNEDIAQFRTINSEGKLPVLVVGRTKEQGFEAGRWNSTLSSAGYPETSKLPKNYRTPPPESAAPSRQAPPVAKAVDGEKTAIMPPATELPPATGNAPPGFRF